MSPERQDREPGLASLSVEPLSELSWHRIERRLFADGAIAPAGAGADDAIPAPAGGGRRRLVLGLAGATAVAAALAVLLWPRTGDREPVVAPVAPAAHLPSRIATEDAPTDFSAGDVALEIAAHSAVLVDGERDGSAFIVLERGEMSCRVAHRAGRPPVVVHAGDARIEVIGTAFSVARAGDSARVVVYEGVVAVLRRGVRTEVAAGETWPDPAAPAEPAAAGPVAAPAIDRDAAGPRPARGETGTGRRGHRAAPAGSGTHAAAESGAAESGASTTSARAGSESGTETPREQAEYERAARLEAADPQAALGIYDRLAHGSGPWAANALYAQARLEVELGRRERARRLLRSYLVR
ncbi:MAG TPA: FecR domain-containing protein, partial [Kofleriaceae bacterium]|nr:FecR domain-containing protein [Kofleriaceae bacterium]